MGKKLITIFLCLALVALMAGGASAYSGSYVPGAGINGTVHDLGTPGANGMNYGAQPADSLQRICIYCHAPHNTIKLSTANGGPGQIGAGPVAPDAFDYLPLWNHTLTANFAGYTMYQNGPGAPTSGAKASQAIQNGMTPGSTSLLCLSCHDGSVAINSYGNSAQLARSQSSGGITISPSYLIGKDNYLGNHHPIGFDYDAVQAADIEIRPADSYRLTPTSTIRDHLYGTGNTKMECGTCHSVHNTGNNGETLLWRSDSQSKLCLSCHAKGAYTAP
ncbi:MAG TPA: cytochrome c3 family protein [Dissulfurispiraceae bacterium]|nr:cytochrome c3 family protein [Dissulfurispiraceae bacterium]